MLMHRLNQKTVEYSITSTFFLRINANENPLSTKTLEKAKNTVIKPMIPNSSGNNNLAKSIPIPNWSICCPNLSRATQKNDFEVLVVNDFPIYSVIKLSKSLLHFSNDF